MKRNIAIYLSYAGFVFLFLYNLVVRFENISLTETELFLKTFHITIPVLLISLFLMFFGAKNLK
jgi:hypothetical protein